DWSSDVCSSDLNPAKVAAVIALTVLLSFVLVWAAAPAQADDETWFNEFHVDAELGEDGRMAVTIDVEYDFQNIESRGIYLNFVSLQVRDGDLDHPRVYDLSALPATSATGAATVIDVGRAAAAGGVYIGDAEEQDLAGVLPCVSSHTVAGIPNAGAGDNGEDDI